MESSFDITRSSRENIALILGNHTEAQLNQIPSGFSNNLIWNIGHIVVVEQMLIYGLSGLPLGVDDLMVNSYRRGTKPSGTVSQSEIEKIRSLLVKLPQKTKRDFGLGVFKTYKEFTTMTGFTLRSVEDAIKFNNYHEAIHTGIMMAISKLV